MNLVNFCPYPQGLGKHPQRGGCHFPIPVLQTPDGQDADAIYYFFGWMNSNQRDIVLLCQAAANAEVDSGIKCNMEVAQMTNTDAILAQRFTASDGCGIENMRRQ